MSEMLSYRESAKFMKEQLQINNYETLLNTDRYKLLCEIQRRLQEHSPFHNFFLMAQDPDKRQKPSWEEIKSNMLSGAGGLCCPKNLFAFYLLQALGFHVILVMAKILIAPNLKHLTLVAQDVKQTGDRYLVDTGILWPCLEPVDLSFELESPILIQSPFRIKYMKEDDKIIRIQQHIKENTYTPLYEMSLDAWNPAQVADYMDTIYQSTNPHPNLLHHVLSCVQYDHNGKVKLLQDNVFTRDTVKFSHDDDDGLIDCILVNFPNLSKNIVNKAVVNWRKAGP